MALWRPLGLPLLYWATCGVTFISRSLATCSAHRHEASRLLCLRLEHGFRSAPFGSPGGMSHLPIDRQAVPVLHGDMAPVAEPGFLCLAPFRYSRLSGSVTLAWVSFRSPRTSR